MNRAVIRSLLLATAIGLTASLRPPVEAAESPARTTTRPTTRPAKVDITIGRDTTYITGPLNKDGTVNYVAYINARYSKGVTPDNNAAIMLVRAIGPELWPKVVRAKAFKAMGMAPLPAKGDYFVTLDDYARSLPRKAPPGVAPEQKATTKRQEELGRKLAAGGEMSAAELEELSKLPPAPPDIADKASDQLEASMRGPWSAKDRPIIAGWLKANAAPLALVVHATKRRRFYLPLISGADPPQMVAVLMPSWVGVLNAAKALSAGAMLKLKTGDRPGAWADLIAARRLGRLVSQGPTLIDHLVGMGVERVACQGCRAFIVDGKLPPARARACLTDLNALGPMPDIRRSIANERFMALDMTMMMARGAMGLAGMEAGPNRALRGQLADAIAKRTLDWDEMLRIFNQAHDRMGKVMAVPDVRKRREGFEKLGKDLQKMAAEARSQTSGFGLVKSITKSILGFRSKQLTKVVAGVLISMLMPAMGKMVDTYDDGMMQTEVLYVAAALALHRTETGRFPAKLTELAPKYLKALPGDRFSGKGLLYKREGKGCVVYSVGMNLTDDGGVDSSEDEDADGEKDDIVVRFKR